MKTQIKERTFETWLSTFKESIATYDYYIDFGVVYQNIENMKIELNILNSLVGSKNIEKEFVNLIKRYPEVLKVIPTLLAKRELDIFCSDEQGAYNYSFMRMNHPIERYCYFMKQTGLFELLQNRLINNVVDYVLGVEAGLNSNGRKNRGGHLMENLVEKFIQKAGFIKDQTYFKEMKLSEIENRFNLNLSALSNNGKTEKRFDFVIISNGIVYACECNFYASGGSKLNETARSYKTLALESKDIPGFKFVWFTDGLGWKNAKGNLQETFDILETIYNINDLENNILDTF